MKKIMLGAVAYTPAVVEIWEGIKEFFIENGCDFDFVLFSNYEAQVRALLDGFIDIAWNTNLAFIKADHALNGKAKVLAMRDTDLGFTTHLIARKESAINNLPDLKGKKIALGSRDSAQAAVMPEYFLLKEGLKAGGEYEALRFNSDVGKHGDTGRSEQEVLAAIDAGDADAGAIGATTWDALGDKQKNYQLIWTSPGYSHCIFTALPDLDEKLCSRFVETLMRMDYENPQHRKLLDAEGLKKWVDASRDGYKQIFDAVEELGYIKDDELTKCGAS